MRPALVPHRLVWVSEMMRGVVRLVDDRTHLVVIPAIAVVVGDHHRGVLPVRDPLEPVSDLDQEALLIQRAGVPGVSVLVGRGLQEADRRIDLASTEDQKSVRSYWWFAGPMPVRTPILIRSSAPLRGQGCRAECAPEHVPA